MIQKIKKTSPKQLITIIIFEILLLLICFHAFAKPLEFEKPMPVLAKIAGIGAENEIRVHALVWYQDLKVTNIYIKELEGKKCSKEFLIDFVKKSKKDYILLSNLEANHRKGGFNSDVFDYEKNIKFDILYENFLKNPSFKCKKKLLK